MVWKLVLTTAYDAGQTPTQIGMTVDLQRAAPSLLEMAD